MIPLFMFAFYMAAGPAVSLAIVGIGVAAVQLGRACLRASEAEESMRLEAALRPALPGRTIIWPEPPAPPASERSYD